METSVGGTPASPNRFTFNLFILWQVQNTLTAHSDGNLAALGNVPMR